MIEIRTVPLYDEEMAGGSRESPNVKQFRGGFVFEAHRLLYHSTLSLRVIKKRRRRVPDSLGAPGPIHPFRIASCDMYRGTSITRNWPSLGPYSRLMPS